MIHSKLTWVGVVVLAWDLGVCSSQGLKFDSLRRRFRWASLALFKKRKRWYILLFYRVQ